ncbi:uncharacterized protein Z519_10222 [Cladophialophora bantiana CBS 173.52]|uniref:BZIP domain-containing protein n=1 Tax=Cladophialophora bantiana (strain ATCC 10958 / CBS 173.52 / CDC B-1940 / NIH 8579) TaxID=1442370 RepID=A0A0D2H7T7_CLAB1|nr:uncharacterized protein Z519_10222 [Cladophialophora bantiana CBS 173.52]KIW89368.1 hypothetical protein Z519_10222 [Cladophialophora bantiana CBS 173.52]
MSIIAPMTLNTEFATSPAVADHPNVWQLPLSTDVPYSQELYQGTPVFDDNGLFFTASPGWDMQRPLPEFVQPQTLHPHHLERSTSPASQASQSRRTGSIDSTTSSVSLSHQQLLRRMSLATIDVSDDSYRPRNTPARRKKNTTSRIAPRSEKHARELELNRRAATKCRNRQKAFVEQLQQRCRKEEEKMQMQTSLVSALHDEVVALRNEVLRQSFCDCRFLSGASTAMLS